MVVDADNWDAVQMFMACATQWRMAVGMGGATPTGLDYSAVQAVIQMRGCFDPGEMFEAIRLLERGYLWGVTNGDLDELLTHG